MVPTHSRVVIIGGGVMGVGLLYHLAHEGWSECVLLEKAELTSGSTWHAAGQITHSTSHFGLAKCVAYGIDLYQELEQETEQSVTWHGCGSLRLAYTDDEYDWLKHTLSIGAAFDHPMEMVTPDFIQKIHPFYQLDGVQAALYTPNDGHVDPAGATFALAKGARQLGAKIIRQCQATDVTQLPTGEWKVGTQQGDIICEHVVNAGGTYAKQIAAWSNLNLPLTSMTHHYLVTEPVEAFKNLAKELPVVRDDRHVSGYVRQEQKSGLIGIYEKANPNSVWLDGTPWEAENELFEPDYDRIMPWLEAALERMPILAEVGIKRTVHGAISHPPDGNPLIGPAAGLNNYWACCGCQIGIGWGPGLTRELARWMVHGSADINMREFDPRRFGEFADDNYAKVKAHEDYLLRHEIPYPGLNRTDGRPVKTSGIYHELNAAGAVFEEVYGWERARWFATEGVEQQDVYGFNRTQLHQVVGREVKAVRERVGIMDISAFAKVIVSGVDAYAFLDSLIPNRLPTKDGRIILTHLLNEKGRIEIETTIVRMATNMEIANFYFTCAAFFEQKLVDILNQHLTTSGQFENVEINNFSSQWGALVLQGPLSRQVLAEVTESSLDNKSFPWLTAQQINVAGNTIWAFRMSYAGELGWEFHMNMDALQPVYQALWQAGKNHGIANYGSFAMNSMRMEKGFKGATELTNEVTLAEADVMRFVKMDKPNFFAKAATQASLQHRLDSTSPWICVYLELLNQSNKVGTGTSAEVGTDAEVGDAEVGTDAEVGDAEVGTGTSSKVGSKVGTGTSIPSILPFSGVDCHGGETVLVRNRAGEDTPIGTISSGAYGHYVQKSLAFAYIDPMYAHKLAISNEADNDGENLYVTVLNEKRPARLLFTAAYDADNVKPRTDAAELALGVTQQFSVAK